MHCTLGYYTFFHLSVKNNSNTHPQSSTELCQNELEINYKEACHKQALFEMKLWCFILISEHFKAHVTTRHLHLSDVHTCCSMYAVAFCDHSTEAIGEYKCHKWCLSCKDGTDMQTAKQPKTQYVQMDWCANWEGRTWEGWNDIHVQQQMSIHIKRQVLGASDRCERPWKVIRCSH